VENLRKEVWYPQLFDRRRYDLWTEAGSKPVDDALRRRGLEILSASKPQPFSAAQVKAIDAVLGRRG
jgi:trimethylamine:corrinoid methyltransferase-like protein